MKEKKESRVFGVLQRIGRSFMLPIALLPIAGLLLGIGSSLTNATTIATYGLESILGEGTILNAIMTVFADTGNIIFKNLPIIFAMGVALGMAEREQATAVLSAMMAIENRYVTSVEGIIDEDVDQSIRNLTRIGSQAMNETDKMVLDIMTSK